jgi:hypothetical protein
MWCSSLSIQFEVLAFLCTTAPAPLPYNLFWNPNTSGKEMTIRTSKWRRRLTTATALVFLSPPLWALDVDELSWTETREKWGQALFCQRIYKLPEVKTRLYDFDIEHCDKADQLFVDGVSRLSKQNQVLLKNQAEQHAIMLSFNTSEPYNSVAACREYCRELAEVKDNRND